MMDRQGKPKNRVSEQQSDCICPGRNELIARYIRLRTGKTRTRKQVSSHIQVLARRRTKEVQSNIRDPATKERAMQTLSHQQQQQQRRVCPDQRHLFASLTAASADATPLRAPGMRRRIADKFPERRGGLRDFLESGPDGAAYLVKFWADINTPIPDEAGAFYGFGTTYESTERLTLSCSTKVCSFGRQVVEKVEKHIGPRLESGRYVYQSDRSPMCEYMVNFITKLRQLPEKYMMNTVLENFTILQVINCESSGDSLLCIAYVFEVSSGAAQHHCHQDALDFEYLHCLAVPNRPAASAQPTRRQSVALTHNRRRDDAGGRGSGRRRSGGGRRRRCVLVTPPRRQSRASRLAPGAGPGRRAAIPRSHVRPPMSRSCQPTSRPKRTGRFQEKLKGVGRANGRLAIIRLRRRQVRLREPKTGSGAAGSGAGSGTGARPGGAAARRAAATAPVATAGVRKSTGDESSILNNSQAAGSVLSTTQQPQHSSNSHFSRQLLVRDYSGPPAAVGTRLVSSRCYLPAGAQQQVLVPASGQQQVLVPASVLVSAKRSATGAGTSQPSVRAEYWAGSSSWFRRAGSNRAAYRQQGLAQNFVPDLQAQIDRVLPALSSVRPDVLANLQELVRSLILPT
uniref:TEA domain-containing protein n=1 Tax=Macrostomum lignano TaxID=282301 RepID=A0A1I8FA39_9PLAT